MIKRILLKWSYNKIVSLATQLIVRSHYTHHAIFRDIRRHASIAYNMASVEKISKYSKSYYELVDHAETLMHAKCKHCRKLSAWLIRFVNFL